MGCVGLFGVCLCDLLLVAVFCWMFVCLGARFCGGFGCLTIVSWVFGWGFGIGSGLEVLVV